MKLNLFNFYLPESYEDKLGRFSTSKSGQVRSTSLPEKRPTIKNINF